MEYWTCDYNLNCSLKHPVMLGYLGSSRDMPSGVGGLIGIYMTVLVGEACISETEPTAFHILGMRFITSITSLSLTNFCPLNIKIYKVSLNFFLSIFWFKKLKDKAQICNVNTYHSNNGKNIKTALNTTILCLSFQKYVHTYRYVYM